MKQPDFIIIGAMKCATSTLHEQLAMQSGIFMTELKEPNFFSNDEQYAKGLNWYLSHFQDARETDLCGESSTHYTKLPTYPDTVKRIRQQFPDVKLIYVMRHPIDRLVSQYIHEWTLKIISVDINRAITQHPELTDYSLYSMQLKPYLETFGKEQILPVFFERFITHRQEELERICRFIGYQKHPTWQTKYDAQNVSSERMRDNAIRDLLVEAPILKEMRQQLIPKSWRTWIRSLWQMREKPEIEPQKLAELQSICDRDLATLGSWFDVKLSCENFTSVVKTKALNWNSIR